MYVNPLTSICENAPEGLREIYQSICNSLTGDNYTKMITQHVGDEPPGDEDYYNMVEEEIIKATGSGRNPNAAAWDPEKTELHRIVNRLLALEDRRALPVRPVEPAVPHKGSCLHSGRRMPPCGPLPSTW